MKLREKVAGLLEATKREIVILCLGLIVYMVTSNPQLWYMQEFLGASKAFFTEKWAYIYRNYGREDFFVMYIVVTTIYSLLIYILANMIFLFVDLTGKPAFFKRYKIQEDKNFPVDLAKCMKCIKVVFFNTVFVGPVFLLVTFPYAYWSGLNCGYQLPTFPQVICQLLVFVLSVEAGFYYTHRLFHHPALYSRIHKIHHEWKAPISVAALYCHPIEYFCCNVFSVMLGPLILGSYFNNHLASVWLWITIATINTTFSHCGYHLPFLRSPEGHDFHHSKFNQNFGVLNILDRLHGTDDVFLKSIEYKRNFVLMGLKSAKELVPDDKKITTD